MLAFVFSTFTMKYSFLTNLDLRNSLKALCITVSAYLSSICKSAKNLPYYKTKNKQKTILCSILTITLHTGIFLAQTCADFHGLPAAENHLCFFFVLLKKTRPLAPAMICRLPKLHISSHLSCMLQQNSQHLSIDIAAEKDFDSAETLLKSDQFLPQHKVAQQFYILICWHIIGDWDLCFFCIFFFFLSGKGIYHLFGCQSLQGFKKNFKCISK